MIPRVLESVTWIKVQKPVFDLVGVVLNSLGLAFLCAVISLVLGVLVTVLAGFVPALRATRVPPIAAVREGAVIQRKKRLTTPSAAKMMTMPRILMATETNEEATIAASSRFCNGETPRSGASLWRRSCR